MTATAELVVDCRNTLGEGVVWSVEQQAVFWTDIQEAKLWRYEPSSGAVRNWKLPERAGSFAFRADGGLIAAFASGFAFFDLETGRRTPISEIEAGLPTRLNDGRCDRQGRFVAGTLDESAQQNAIAAVYRVNHDRSVDRIIDSVVISNSLCFSPDGQTLYFANTPERVIRAYDYDPATGAVSKRRTFSAFDDQPGYPDGSTVDAEGCLWNARWQGRRVVRYRPDGSVDRVIGVPAPNVTCVALGGPHLDTLYVTTARQGMTGEELEAEPPSGGLFAVDVGIRGLPEAKFAGRP